MTFLEMVKNPQVLTLDERIFVRNRLEPNIRQNRSVEESRELLSQLHDAGQQRPDNRVLHDTKQLAWDKHTSAASQFCGFDGEEHVATVRRRAHHPEKDKNVVYIWFGESEIASENHHFPDAIRIGGSEWRKRAGQGNLK